MNELNPPLKQYVLGKMPSHCGTSSLAENFSGMTQDTMLSMLTSAGYLENSKPTRQAVVDGLLFRCEKKLLWDIEKVKEVFESQGLTMNRQYVNQKITPPSSSESQFVSLSVISTYFNVSSTKVGQWLKEIGLREEDGTPTKDAQDRGLVQIVDFETRSNEGKKTSRQFGVWNLYETQKLLVSNGHPLDMDYSATLKGKGRNGDVTVASSSVFDERVKEFLQKFTPLYNEKNRGCIALVSKTPRIIQEKAETKLGKPGFFTKNAYKKRVI